MFEELFLVNEQIRPFIRDQRIDLVASDSPRLGDGRYVVYEDLIPKGQVQIVTSWVPYAMERTDIGTANESMKMILPEDGNGFFSYSPLVNGQTPYKVDINYNAPKTAAAAGDAERQRRSGVSMLSINPYVDAVLRSNTILKTLVPSDGKFQVSFELLPAGTVGTPIPNPYAISASGAKRVDFAGIVATGVVMPASLYGKMINAMDLKESK